MSTQIYRGNEHIFTNRGTGTITLRAGPGESLNIGTTSTITNFSYTIPNSYISVTATSSITATGFTPPQRYFGISSCYDSTNQRLYITDFETDTVGIDRAGSIIVYDSSYSQISRMTISGVAVCGSFTVIARMNGTQGAITDGANERIGTAITKYFSGTSLGSTIDQNGTKFDVNSNGDVVFGNSIRLYFTPSGGTVQNLGTIGIASSVSINTSYFSYAVTGSSQLLIRSITNPSTTFKTLYLPGTIQYHRMNNSLLVVVLSVSSTNRQQVRLYNSMTFDKIANLFIQHGSGDTYKSIRDISITDNMVMLIQGSNPVSSFFIEISDIVNSSGSKQFFLVNGLTSWIVDAHTNTNTCMSGCIAGSSFITGNPTVSSNQGAVTRSQYTLSTSPSGTYATTYITCDSDGITFNSDEQINFNGGMRASSIFSGYGTIGNCTTTTLTCTTGNITTLTSSTCIVTNMSVTNLTAAGLNVSGTLTCTSLNLTSLTASITASINSLSSVSISNLTSSGSCQASIIYANLAGCKSFDTSTASISAGSTILWQNISVNGMSYDSTTGIFSPQETGHYLISFRVTFSSAGTISMNVNGLTTTGFFSSTDFNETFQYYLLSTDTFKLLGQATGTITFNSMIVTKC